MDFSLHSDVFLKQDTYYFVRVLPLEKEVINFLAVHTTVL